MSSWCEIGNFCENVCRKNAKIAHRHNHLHNDLHAYGDIGMSWEISLILYLKQTDIIPWNIYALTTTNEY